MKITFLGTSSMMPTATRNHSSILFNYKDENILVDCGEGTQRQFRVGNLNPLKITKILITHWHGDHVLGLPGLLQNLYRNNYNKTLEIYGPKGTKLFLQKMFEWFYSDIKLKISIKEVEEGIFFENQDFKLECTKLDHKVPCLGYSFIEKNKRKINMNYLKKFNLKNNPIIRELQLGKDIIWEGRKIKNKLATKTISGKKVSFILDTGFTKNILKLAKDSNVLICESTHGDELIEKAKKFKHLTSKQAALIAKQSKCKELILTHFSQRYKETNNLLKEAKRVFKNTSAANDFDWFEI